MFVTVLLYIRSNMPALTSSVMLISSKSNRKKLDIYGTHVDKFGWNRPCSFDKRARISSLIIEIEKSDVRYHWKYWETKTYIGCLGDMFDLWRNLTAEMTSQPQKPCAHAFFAKFRSSKTAVTHESDVRYHRKRKGRSERNYSKNQRILLIW